jgi:hypothetical protein
MREPYLEVTFRHGRPLAAYLYLPRTPDQKSYKTKEHSPGFLVDYARGGTPIGIELTAPDDVSLVRLNRVLVELGQPKLKRTDLAPLRAA